MRIIRIRAPAFGGLRDLDTGDAPLPGLVVVEGRNEAGKSTFLELLSVLLYGFYPANRDAYPFAPWDGSMAEGTGHIRLEDGSEVEVHRRLLSTPAASLTSGSREEELRNHTVPWAEHVPRAVFRQVFALSLAELTGLEGAGWEAVQDRLLGTMGASDLRSARQVVAELRNDAGTLWRTSRRGSQEVRVLRERVRDLGRRRHEAVEGEARIRDLSASRRELEQALVRAREEREDARARVARVDDLLPVRRRLARIEELQDRAGDRAALDGIPSNPRERLAELGRQLERWDRRIGDLEAAREEPCAAMETFGDQDRSLLDREEQIRALEAAQAAAEPLRVRQGQLEQEVGDRSSRLDAGLRAVLGREAGDPERAALMELSIPRLDAALRSLVDARERARERGRPLPPSPSPGAGALWPGLGLCLAGVAGLIGGWAFGSTVAFAVGAGLLVVGIGEWIRYTRSRPGSDDRGTERARDLARAEADVDRAAEALGGILHPLVPHGPAREAGPELASRLERLQELAREADARRSARATVTDDLQGLSDQADALRPLLDEAHRHAEAAATAHLLGGALQAAARRRDEARAAARELQRLDRERSEAQVSRDEVAADHAVLRERLAALAQGDADRGLAEAEVRLDARESARRLREDLERDQTDLDAVRARIAQAEAAGERWVADPESVARSRARIQGLSEEVEELTRRAEAVEKDLQHLADRPRLDEIDGEILTTEAEIDRLVRRRDRLWTLSRVVQEAERRLRDEHQPAILKEASTLLAGLTAGRYDRIVLAGRDGRSFRVRGPAAPRSLPVERPLSTGTREQVYLALRLAILDQLDRAGERLPLFLDEVLVNWDPARQEAGLRTLAHRAEGRQCFFFTCHPTLADRLEQLGAARVRLQGP